MKDIRKETAMEIIEILTKNKMLITNDYSKGYSDCIITIIKIIDNKYKLDLDKEE